jgi:hypothetical protein
VDTLIAQLTKQVTYGDEPPYPELEQALRRLICIIQGQDCGDEDIDWAQTIAEATTLRPIPA